MHLVEGSGKLRAVFRHAVVYEDHLVVGLAKGALAMLGAARAFLGGAAKLLEALGMVVFENGSLLEEKSKFLDTGE